MYVFLTGELDGGERSAWLPGRSTAGKYPSPTHWLGDKVDSRAVLEDLVEEENSLLPSGKET